MQDPKTEDAAYEAKYSAGPAEIASTNSISADLQKFLEGKDELKTLEDSVHLHLLSLNRHDRRAWLARSNRKAGAVRFKALTVRNAAVK